MKMRYAILILFTTFLWAGVRDTVMSFRLEFNSYWLGTGIVWLSILSFLAWCVARGRWRSILSWCRGVLIGLLLHFLLLVAAASLADDHVKMTGACSPKQSDEFLFIAGPVVKTACASSGS